MELHADYLSGYFIGQIKRDRPHVNLRKFGDFLFHSGTYDFRNPDFHGTPQERVRAAEEGFRLATKEGSFADAARVGRVCLAEL